MLQGKDYRNAPYYPAQILSASGGIASLEWFSGNVYGPKQKPLSHPRFNLRVQECVELLQEFNDPDELMGQQQRTVCDFKHDITVVSVYMNSGLPFLPG